MSSVFVASIAARSMGLVLFLIGIWMLVWNRKITKALLATQVAVFGGTRGRLRRWTVPEEESRAARYLLVYERVVVLVCAIGFIAFGVYSLVSGTQPD